MENAAKALLMAGSILFGVLIISVAVYVFGQGKSFTESVGVQKTEEEIASFNAQFSVYQTDSSYNSLTKVDSKRYSASKDLNTIADVVSAVNLAVSINEENNYGYSYTSSTGVETANAVEVVVIMKDISSTLKTSLKNTLGLSTYYDYYLIEPNQNVQSGYLYGTTSLGTTRSNRISSFSAGNPVSLNKLMSALNESKLVTYNNSNYTVYRYYFRCNYDVDEQGQINTISFIMLYDSTFDTL